MIKKISLILTAIFCMVFFCACSAEESKPKYDIPLGTYRYIHEDGSVSDIILTKDTVKYVNVDLESGREVSAFERYIAASAKANAEGRKLTEAEIQELREKDAAVDFNSFQNKELAYIISDETDISVNIAAMDENGEPIYGLEATFYLEEKQLGFDEYYILVEE